MGSGRWGGEAITDASDWPKEPPELRSLDSSMRCKICQDIYEVPLSLSCGHCFCSSCIRSNISYQLKQNTAAICPCCREVCDEAHLRPVLAVKEIVQHFNAIRSFLIETTKTNLTPSQKPPGQNPSNFELNSENSNQRDASVEWKDKNQRGGVWIGKSQKRKARESFRENCQKRVKGDDGLEFGRQCTESKLRAPPKLCFTLLSRARIAAKLAEYNLSTEGGKLQLEKRYTAFRNYVETAVDGGRCTTLKILAREFSSAQNRRKFAQSRAQELDIPKMGFSDLMKQTRVRLAEKNGALESKEGEREVAAVENLGDCGELSVERDSVVLRSSQVEDRNGASEQGNAHSVDMSDRLDRSDRSGSREPTPVSTMNPEVHKCTGKSEKCTLTQSGAHRRKPGGGPSSSPQGWRLNRLVGLLSQSKVQNGASPDLVIDLTGNEEPEEPDLDDSHWDDLFPPKEEMGEEVVSDSESDGAIV